MNWSFVPTSDLLDLLLTDFEAQATAFQYNTVKHEGRAFSITSCTRGQWSCKQRTSGESSFVGTRAAFHQNKEGSSRQKWEGLQWGEIKGTDDWSCGSLCLKGPIQDIDFQPQPRSATAMIVVAVAVDGLPTNAASDLFNLTQFILINLITYLNIIIN